MTPTLVHNAGPADAIQISLFDVAAGKSRKLPELRGGASSLQWMPDGSAVLAVSDIHPDCGVEPKCIDDKEKPAPSKARIIDSLLFRHWNAWQAPARAHILHIPIGQGTPRDLTPGAFDAPPFSIGGGSEFDVSPDGKELVYARNTDRDAALSTNSDLFIVPIAGGEAKRITTRTGADTAPQYSPDGRWIAYRSQERGGYESDLWELWLYDRASGRRSASPPISRTGSIASPGRPTASPSSPAFPSRRATRSTRSLSS